MRAYKGSSGRGNKDPWMIPVRAHHCTTPCMMQLDGGDGDDRMGGGGGGWVGWENWHT